jgi:tRNA (mo5U34)-methyltransferase
MRAPIEAQSIREARLRQDRSKELSEKGWYHSFELPDGTFIDGVNPLSVLRQRYARFRIPQDLHGKRVLDIGAWDGWFSFEAERHGAAVTAIDCVEVEHFLELHRKLCSHVDYRILDVFELPEAGLGSFDIVFFVGVLYHLKRPLLALEIVCSLTTDIAIVESFVTDGATWQEHADDIPTMEFYEGTELANQFDNWVGPSVSCLLAMCRAAGFARVELLHTEPYNALVACYRKWEPPPAPALAEPPDLVGVGHNANLGINFSSRKDEYPLFWFRSSRASISKEDLRTEVDGFGVIPHDARYLGDDYWLASCRLPPWLCAGWKLVRLRFADSDFSQALRIAVDMPLRVSRIEIRGVRDGATWNVDEVSVDDRALLVCWLSGLPENCDHHNVRAYLGEIRLRVYWVGTPDAEGRSQLNALLPAGVPKGRYELRIECGGVSSDAWPVNVK